MFDLTEHDIDPEVFQNYQAYKEFIKSTPYGFDKATSHGRFMNRLRDWCSEHKADGLYQFYAWWLFHNCIVHPAIGLFPSDETVDLHEWASEKLDTDFRKKRNKRIKREAIPKIPNKLAWIKHNVLAHMAIGLAPCSLTFFWHDKTAEEMGVEGWK